MAVVDAEVVVVADASPERGLGHISRSGAVAAALRAQGHRVACFGLGGSSALERDDVEWEPLAAVDAVPAPRDGGLLVLDSYTVSYPEAFAQLDGAASIAGMHPGGSPDGVLHAVVSPVPRKPAPQVPLVLEGLEFACLRPLFWDLRPGSPAESQSFRVLVTAGATDEPAVIEAATSVRRALPSADVTVVRGLHATWAPPDDVAVLDAPESLLEAIAATDVVVTAGGQTAFEALASARATVVFVTAANQRAQAEYLVGRDLVIGAPRPSAVGEAVATLARGGKLRGELASRGRAAVDGLGALRVAKALSELI